MEAFIHWRGEGDGSLIYSFAVLWGSRYWNSHLYGFGHFSNVCCHAPVPLRMLDFQHLGKMTLQAQWYKKRMDCSQQWTDVTCPVLSWFCIFTLFGGRADFWPKLFSKLLEEQNLWKNPYNFFFLKSARAASLTHLLKAGDRYSVQNALGL